MRLTLQRADGGVEVLWRNVEMAAVQGLVGELEGLFLVIEGEGGGVNGEGRGRVRWVTV